jgi:hypothetical protein
MVLQSPAEAHLLVDSVRDTSGRAASLTSGRFHSPRSQELVTDVLVRDLRTSTIQFSAALPHIDSIYKSMLVTLACEASEASEACEFWECYCAFSCFTSNSRERTVPNLQVDVGHSCMRGLGGLRILRMLLYFHNKYFEGHAHILSHYLV